ncbi:DUF4231 domain-containing protein [Kribbella sp. NPDC020789]
MTNEKRTNEPADEYALRIADGSYEWYRTHAIRSRQYYKCTETLTVLTSAAIPISGLIGVGSVVIPSLIGAVVFILVGLRSIFHWHENYLRFSQAREAIEAERRSFHTSTEPYTDISTRAQILVAAISRIEQEEMGTWLKTAATQARPPSARVTPTETS